MVHSPGGFERKLGSLGELGVSFEAEDAELADALATSLIDTLRAD